MSTNAQPAAATSTGMGGLCLSSGVEGAVTSALSYLQQILCEINYQELRENEQMAVANKNVAEDGAENILEQGQQQFVDALAQGVGTIGGSFVSLGTMAYGEYSDPDKANIESLDKELEDVKSQKTLSNSHPSILENASDSSVIEETPDTLDTLEAKEKELLKSKQELSNAQGARRQTFATLGGSLGQIAHGMGTAIGAFAKKAGMEAQAAAQLDSSSSQSMLSIMGQLLKTANDALSQAQQTIQNMATISNGNRYN